MATLSALERRLDAAERATERETVDIALRLRVRETGYTTGVYGGRCVVGEARYLTDDELSEDVERTGEPLDVHTLECGADHLAFILDFETKMVVARSGRRKGKSEALATKLVVHLVAFPGFFAQVISPTFRKTKIMWKKIAKRIPRHWYDGRPRRAPEWDFSLRNGSFNQMLSAKDSETLIGEGVWALFYDEWQSIKEDARMQAMPSLSDGGANWQEIGCMTPRMGEAKARYERIAGHRLGKAYHFSRNPFIDTSLLAEVMADQMTSRRFRREWEGEFTPDEGLCYFMFERDVHAVSWRRHEQYCRDVTRAYCAEHLSVGAADYVIGVDYGVGHQYATIYKIVQWTHDLRTGAPLAQKWHGLWAVDTEYRESATDAERLGQRLTDRGYGPRWEVVRGRRRKAGTSVIIGDVWGESGFSASRRWDAMGFEVRQPGSQKQNPVVEDRVEAMGHLIQSASGLIRWAVDPDGCPELIQALESQEERGGKPVKDGWNDNRADSAGYPPFYLFRYDPADEDEEREAA